MYIRLPATTRRLYDRDVMDEPIEVDHPGERVRVSAAVGEALADRYPGVRIVEDEREGHSADDRGGRDAEDDRDEAGQPEDRAGPPAHARGQGEGAGEDAGDQGQDQDQDADRGQADRGQAQDGPPGDDEGAAPGAGEAPEDAGQE